MARSVIHKLLIPALLVIFAGAASADVLDEILERGTIRVGVAEFPPWTIKTASGDLIGFEIELSNRLAKDMGRNEGVNSKTPQPTENSATF